MLTTDLYPYQNEAVDRAINEGSLLVAYEMGLGKTLVALGACEDLMGNDLIDTTLVIVPAALKFQWARSIAKFTDVGTKTIRMRKTDLVVPEDKWCQIVHGTPEKRLEQYKNIRRNRPQYTLATYENVLNDWAEVKRLNPDCIVLDEATAIKGFQAKRSKRVKILDADYRIALTGTPIENRPEEGFSIMEFIDPSVLGRWDLFDKSFIKRNYNGWITGAKNLDIFHAKMKQAMTRKTRLDPDVRPFLPDVVEETRFVSMTPAAKRLYKRIGLELLGDLAELQAGDFDVSAYYQGFDEQNMGEVGRAMAKQMALQMLCDHPALLQQSADRWQAYDGGSEFVWTLWKTGALDHLGNSSEKFEQVCRDVRDILDQNPKNKVIIFSFFTHMADLFAKELDGYHTVKHTGKQNRATQEAAKVMFQTDPDCRVFLSSDAGGYGVDLPQANYLINFDLHHSAGKMDQRNARHVRADKTWHDKVYILNYVVEGSVEERIMSRLGVKRAISTKILDGHGADTIENDTPTLTEYLEATVGGAA